MTPSFSTNLEKYAQLVVHTALNIADGDELAITISIGQAEFAHRLTAAAYQAGASRVLVRWQDDQLQRLDLTYQSELTLQTSSAAEEQALMYIAERRVKRLVVLDSDPQRFAALNPAKLAAFQNRPSRGQAAVRAASRSNQLSWVIIAAASPAWAQRVFPASDRSAATTQLWQAIFQATRVDQPDPQAAWRAHNEQLNQRATWLNQQQFTALHYRAPGTDLTVGLPQQHVWMAASAKNARGEVFIPNLPTEEIFTAPDLHHVEGTVRSTKPLSYGGTILRDLQFNFHHGRVVTATAATGQAQLEQLLASDEGARHLGEVALVPDQTPISQSGLIFYNTLFDENASDHLALGAAYPFSIRRGTKLSVLQLQKAGLNVSQVHVDFMIGSAEMAIDGLDASGHRTPLFRKGNWAK